MTTEAFVREFVRDVAWLRRLGDQILGAVNVWVVGTTEAFIYVRDVAWCRYTIFTTQNPLDFH